MYFLLCCPAPIVSMLVAFQLVLTLVRPGGFWPDPFWVFLESNQPFCHSTDRQTHRHTDRWDRREVYSMSALRLLYW